MLFSVIDGRLSCHGKLLLRVVRATLVVSVGIATSSMAVETKRFDNPKVGGKLLDGSYSWPGPCEAEKQAIAFCKRKGYPKMFAYVRGNKVGVFQTKRLGDGGTCTASCSIMTYVICEVR